MGSVQQNPELSTGEKIVKVIGRAIIACLVVVAWGVRRIWPPNWK